MTVLKVARFRKPEIESTEMNYLGLGGCGWWCWGLYSRPVVELELFVHEPLFSCQRGTYQTVLQGSNEMCAPSSLS